MGVWAMLLVVPAGQPEPDSAWRTPAVIDGWDSWLLPIARDRDELRRWIRIGNLAMLFTVTGDSTVGQVVQCSRRSLGNMGISPVSGEDCWRFRPSTLDFLTGFIKESGPRGVRRTQVVTALTESTYDTQLRAVHGLLRALRLSRNDEFAEEDYLAGHTASAAELPAVFRSDPRGSGVRAIALDHSAPGWQWLAATQDLDDYGEPPCLVRTDVGGMFVASDPPVSLRFFEEKNLTERVGPVDWVDVPGLDGGSLEDYIAWARDNVGVAGRPVSTARRPLRGEVDDEPPELHEAHFPAWRYRLAQRPTLEISLSQRAPVLDFAAGVAALLDTIRQKLLLPLAAAYRGAGGEVFASPYGWLGAPNQMLIAAVSPRARGDDDTYAFDTDDWHRAVDAVARDRRKLELAVDVCDPTGFASGLRWGRTQAVIAPRRQPDSVTLTIAIAEPQLALLDGVAPMLAIIERAITDLGLSAGSASIGRITRRPHWLTLLDESQLAAVGGADHLGHKGLFHQVRTIESPTGAITWLQATEDPAQFDATHAARISDHLGVRDSG